MVNSFTDNLLLPRHVSVYLESIGFKVRRGWPSKISRSSVAIKIIDTSTVREPYVIKNLTREAKLLAKLQHPSIVYLYETIRCNSSYYLVTELATGGDLYTHIRKQPAGHLDEATAKCYARQLVSALNHIHLQGIVHRDLKMENIMLKDNRKKHIKIIDFGLSNWSTGSKPLETHCGSPEYAAPELFLMGQKYGPEVDLWSLGVILYGMVTGQLPFVSPRNDKTSPEEWRRKLMSQIFRGLTTLQEKKICAISRDYKNLVRRLLEPIAHRRIPMGEIFRHPWLADNNKNIFDPILPVPSKTNIKTDVLSTVFREINNVTRLDDSTINETIRLKPYGEIGGMFNIKTHKLMGTGSIDVFEGSSSSITRKIRTVGRILSKESALKNVSTKSSNLINCPSIRRATLSGDCGGELPILGIARERSSGKCKKSSSTSDSITKSNFATKILSSAKTFCNQKEEIPEQKNGRRSTVAKRVTKSTGNTASISARPMTEPHLLDSPDHQFSPSLAKSTNYSHSRPSCPGTTILFRNESFAKLQRWMDNKEKTYRQQRYSAPDVGTCTRRQEKNLSTAQTNRVGRIAMPLISTNWRNSRVVTRDNDICQRRVEGKKILGKSAVEKYGSQKSRQNHQTNSNILERGQTFLRPNQLLDYQKCYENDTKLPRKYCKSTNR